MLNVLTCGVPSLEAALRSGYFCAAGARVTTAGDSLELLARAGALQPELILLSSSLRHQAQPVVVALRRIISPCRTLVLLGIARGGTSEDPTLYDGVVCLEDPELELARAVSRWRPAPRRRYARTRDRLPMQLRGQSGRVYRGVALDVSGHGVGGILRYTPEWGERPRPTDVHKTIGSSAHSLLLERPGGRRVEVAARVAWMSPVTPPALRVGLDIEGASEASIRALRDLALWERISGPSGDRIFLHGEISAQTTFAGLLPALHERTVIDLADLVRVDAAGFLLWGGLNRELPEGVTIENAPADLFRKMASLPRAAKVVSIRARCRCPACALEIEPRVELSQWVAENKRLCPLCGRRMDFVDAAEPAMGALRVAAGGKPWL